MHGSMHSCKYNFTAETQYSDCHGGIEVVSLVWDNPTAQPLDSLTLSCLMSGSLNPSKVHELFYLE